MARLLQGNEACALGAIAAGCKFFAGYPITPSTEIAEILAAKLPDVDGTFIQMEDEIASICAATGASIAGVKSLTATSGPGFSLKQEALGFAIMAEIPLVIVNVQRLGPSTGLPTAPGQGDIMQTRWGTHGDHPIIALYPWSVEEAFYLTVKAFNLAEQLRTPVILLLDEVIAHMRESVQLPEKVETVTRKEPSVGFDDYLPYSVGPDLVPSLATLGGGYRYHITGLFHGQDGFPTNDEEAVENLIHRQHDKVSLHQAELTFVDEYACEDADHIIIAYGAPARAAREAVELVRNQGLKVGLCRLATIWPFPKEHVSKLAQQARTLIIPEMNMGQIAGVVKEVTGHPRIISLPKFCLHSVEQILTTLQEVV